MLCYVMLGRRTFTVKNKLFGDPLPSNLVKHALVSSTSRREEILGSTGNDKLENQEVKVGRLDHRERESFRL